MAGVLVPQRQEWQEYLLVCIALSILAPPLPYSSSSRCFYLTGLVHFTLMLTLVTSASTLLIFSATTSTHARKFGPKDKDLSSGSQIGTPKTRDNLMQQLWLGQYSPRASQFVFDRPWRLSFGYRISTRLGGYSQVQAEDTQHLHHHSRLSF